MAHYVICVYCKERYDRDKEPTVNVSGKRYAHEKCYNKQGIVKNKEEQDYEKLEKYIMNLFSKEYLTAKVRKQIRDYRQEYNYTFEGMLRSLKWWYEIKGQSLEKANEGIGIIPFIYEQAEKYYYSLLLAQLNNDETKNYNPNPVIIKISPPEVDVDIYKKNKLFKMEE